MRKAAIAAILVWPAALPAGAQTAGEDISAMTCGAFLELGEDGQMAAMLDLRAAYAGEDVPATEEASAATTVTGATEAGARGGMEGEEPVEAEAQQGSAETRQRLAGLRTSCMGAPDVPAIDALVAAHADYDPAIEPSAALE